MTLQQIGRYQIKDLLGEGAMGQVYRARDPALNRDVALKLISLPRQSDNTEMRPRFRREVQAASQLNHPHIVTIYDVDLDHEPPFVVMELLTGGTLKEQSQSSQPSWSEAVKMLQPLCQALAYAHQAGIIHRDVKPANVMFSGDEAGTLKLVDFGLARWPEAPQVTRTGGVVGTPAYMSPEQANGEQVDNRTDIYALGLVLFEMIAGFNPQERKSTGQTWATAVSREPVDLTPLTGKAPPQLISVLKRALAKERERRYDDALVLWQDLEACLSHSARKSIDSFYSQEDKVMPDIDVAQGITLTAEAKDIIGKMFAGHQRLFVSKEFGGGFTESRVYGVHPDDVSLPAVVKIAPRHLILQEQEAFNTCIRSHFANVVAIQGEPVWSTNGTWGGLQYHQAGHDIFPTKSLHEYYQAADTEAVTRALNRLFQVMGLITQKAVPQSHFNLQGSYDRLLPVNLLIEADNDLPDEVVQLIEQQTLSTLSLEPGAFVRLKDDFVITEVDVPQGELTLNWHPSRADNWKSYRLRVRLVNGIEQYQVGETADIKGVIQETRNTLLQAQAEEVMGREIGLAKTAVTLANGKELPNPLQKWPKILAERPFVKVACVHGDFNPENILIDMGTGDFSLIDFAEARKDHILHDLLRLETGIVTRFLPEALAEADLSPETICQLYEQLHCTAVSTTQLPRPNLHPALEKPFAVLTAVRKMARTALFNAAHWSDSASWTEYYHGLTLYLLGALKFKNLDSLAKQLAFWGATTTLGIVASAPPCEEPRPQEQSSDRRQISLPAWLVIAVIILVSGLGFLAWWSTHSDRSRGEPVAVIMHFNPEVAVQRGNSSRLQEAAFALELFRDDVVLTYENAFAVVGCQNGLLFQMPAENNMTIACEETADPRLIARVEPQLISVARPISVTLAADDTRSPRGEAASTPHLLSPRNTFIAETRPTFTWQPIEGVRGYRLSVSLPDGRSWNRETMDTSLPYPADAPLLAPGSVNIVTLVTLDDSHTADRSLLRVLDEAALAAVNERETAIRSLGLDAASEAYLLAQLYQEENLLAPALAQLETLAQGMTPLSANGWQHLGDLYFAVKLYALAEENYEMALETAVTANDLSAQAAANVGLARSAHAFRETEQALDYLETAETLYQQAGEDELAKQIKAEKDRLEQ